MGAREPITWIRRPDYRLDPFNVPMDPAQVVLNIEEGIISLYRLGARDVIVLDLPDLGLIPANGGDPNASAISTLHNALLDAGMADLQVRFPSLHLIYVKLDPLFHELLGMSACLFVNPSACETVKQRFFNMNPGFLFWGVVHPTTEAHHYLADYLYEQLAASYD